jgi:predicted transcriptional regulator
MTMQIHRAEMIADVPIMKVRSFCLYAANLSWCRPHFDIHYVRNGLYLSKDAATRLVQELKIQGYIKEVNLDAYEITDKGRKLARSSAGQDQAQNR